MMGHKLIAQLGGYEEAKKQCESMHDLDIFKQDGDVYAKSYIEDVLLEYRCEHKIYAVGDFIIDSLIGNKVIKYHAGYENMPADYISFFLRHATDEEVKANCRLISLPLTKMIDICLCNHTDLSKVICEKCGGEV